MNDDKKLFLKQQLKLHGLDVLEERVNTSRKLMEAAQLAANSEEKSSAGDKYETSRAMNQLDKNMYARQLNSHLMELSALQQLNVAQLFDHITQGAFLQTNSICFFIAAGLGKQLIDGKTVYFISHIAPLALALKHKKIGDTILFQQSSLVIESIF